MKKNFTLLLLLLLISIFSLAQDSNTELLKKLVEKNVLTQSEADSLSILSSEKTNRNEINTIEKIRKAFNTPYMQFGGYGMMMYKYNNMASTKHSLDARVLFLHVRGDIFKNFNYFAMYEFIKPTLTEFYVQWTPDKRFNLRVGQGKIPLSLENQLSLTVLESITNSRSTSSLIGMGDDVLRWQNGKSNGGRDMGILSYGSLIETKTHDLLEYGIGIFQGTGLVTGETNNTKDFAGNLLVQPIKGWRIGGGAYFGEATYTKDGEDTKSDHVRNRWIASSDYKSDRVYARAEWIKANDGGIQKEGLHGMGLFYFMPEKLNTFAKIDYLNQNTDINKEVTDYHLGINYYFYKSCRLQLNYTYSDYSKKWDARNTHSVLGQMQIVF
ncbi:porin [Dysgonomonas sp. 511]|uniref:porin n=1 Tax=Dysgonomonas sp. 511 TaxID=2302930 RepID=UPI0013D5300C|nr:porin [Dysgonomonas sp. 511]NDV78054.1 hypothetical protein [Dysgonomonas sp. 511]